MFPANISRINLNPLVAAGMSMEDGKGVLADGTRYEKRTSEEFGADGYWLRTTIMRGVSAGGKVGPAPTAVPVMFAPWCSRPTARQHSTRQ